MNPKPRVLITGGAGFVGSHTARALLDRGCEVFILDFFHQYIFPLAPSFLGNMQYRFDVLNKGAEVIRGNMNNKEDLRRKLLKIKPDRIIHLAALPLANVARWQTEEAFESTVAATFNLLDVLGDAGSVKRLVYVSSSMVYGDFEKTPMPEEGRKDPKNIYGGMKLAGEVLVRIFSRHHNIPFVIVRPSAVYGPTDNNRRVLQIFIESALAQEVIEVADPERTLLDFTYVSDAAQGLALAALKDEALGETFNITYGSGRSLADAVRILEGILGKLKVKVQLGEDKFKPSRGSLDVSKARRLLGYAPAYPLEKGLAEYVAFVRGGKTPAGPGSVSARKRKG